MADLIEITKSVYELAKKGANLELQQKVMELREEAIKLQEQNLVIRKENLELKEKNEARETLRYDRQVYYRDGDAIPFCPYCYERHQQLVHLTGPRMVNSKDASEQFYSCQGCNIKYRTVQNEDFTVWDSCKKTR